jgi:hypothetical protein
VMTFIEWELFQDKRMILTFSADILIHFIWMNPDGIYWIGVLHETEMNLIVYELLPIDFIGMKSWYHLLNESLSR